MFKFLRKYNKLILAVGGVLLMITFLIPQAITQLSRRAGERKATIARVGNNEKVSIDDWSKVQAEVKFMEDLGVGIRGLGPIQKPAHWYLLVREAEQAGLIGAPSLSDEEMQMIRMRTRTGDPEFVRQAIARYEGVNMMINLFENSAVFSDRRMKTFAERMMHMVSAETVVIEADKDKVQIEPTQEEMQKQLDLYADKLPGEGEMGFGYKLPNRVKLEWLTVSADSVRNMMRNSPEFNGVAQRVHWRKHAPPAGSTTQPAAPGAKNFPPVDDSGQVPEVVRNDLLDELTAQKLDEATVLGFDHDEYGDQVAWDVHPVFRPRGKATDTWLQQAFEELIGAKGA